MCTIIYTDCDDHAKPGIWALRIKTHVWLSTHDTYWTWKAQIRSCRPVLTRSNGNLARVRTRRVVVDKWWADGQPVQNLKTCQTIVQQPTPEPTQSTNWIDDAMTKTLARLSLYCIVFGASGIMLVSLNGVMVCMQARAQRVELPENANSHEF